ARREERDERGGCEGDQRTHRRSPFPQNPFVGAKRQPPSVLTMKPGVGKCAARTRTPESAWRSTNARRVSRAFAGSDRKSTRLNSSHVSTSYAVFCLKKKRMMEIHYASPDPQLAASVKN